MRQITKTLQLWTHIGDGAGRPSICVSLHMISPYPFKYTCKMYSWCIFWIQVYFKIQKGTIHLNICVKCILVVYFGYKFTLNTYRHYPFKYICVKCIPDVYFGYKFTLNTDRHYPFKYTCNMYSWCIFWIQVYFKYIQALSL